EDRSPVALEPADRPRHPPVSSAPLTRFQRAFYVLVRTVLRTFAAVWFRAEVTGRQNLPPSGAYIVAPAHRSNLDTPLMPIITHRNLRAMGKDTLWTSSKLLAWFLTAVGGFPVAR